MRSPHKIAPHCNAIAYRMFLDTADLDYIGARAAYFEQRDWAFWWSALHALEKYLKTILLMNGRSAAHGGHDLHALLGLVRAIDARLVPSPLVRPSISGLDYWPDYPDATFMRRLNDFGSPSNRYGTYGYTLMLSDLLRADQLIFWARRHALQLKQTFEADATVHTIDWIDELARNPKRWRLYAGPLETIAALPARSTPRRPLAKLNAAFFPDRRHTLTSWRTASANGPLAEWAEALTTSGVGSTERALAGAVIDWVIGHIQLATDDRKQLVDLLATHL